MISIVKRCSNLLTHLQNKLALRKLKSISLTKEDVVIDCGANVGEITQVFADKQAQVHAFEPNPHAYNYLKQRFEQSDHVFCHHQAV